MRVFASAVLASVLAAGTLLGCAPQPLPTGRGSASKNASKTTNDAEDSPSGDDAKASQGDDDNAGADASGSQETPSVACNGTAIAAFADRLAVEARKSCTSNGAGVVTDTNFSCMRDPIFKLAPPFPDAAFARVEYWAKNGNNFAGKTSLLQCVDYAFVVTAAVCGKPINAGDAQIDENMQIPGYTYMSRTAAQPQAGDVLVMDGHIAITAAVTGPSRIRVAEANCLTLGGQMTSGADTGVISNTRTDTMDDSWILGWYRKQ